jgi:hypothetical protein
MDLCSILLVLMPFLCLDSFSTYEVAPWKCEDTPQLVAYVALYPDILDHSNYLRDMIGECPWSALLIRELCWFFATLKNVRRHCLRHKIQATGRSWCFTFRVIRWGCYQYDGRLWRVSGFGSFSSAVTLSIFWYGSWVCISASKSSGDWAALSWYC